MPLHPYGAEGFMLISRDGLTEPDRRLADRSLGMQAVRVLVAMLQSCDYGNRVCMGPKDLASHLAMDQAAVSKATRSLVECGLIERPETSRGYYRINPFLLWKGSASALKQEIEKRRAAA